MKISDKLISLRKEKRMTQQELAEELNISRQAVSRWETGTSFPTTENLASLSRFYQVPMDYLLIEDTEKGLESESISERKEEGYQLEDIPNGKRQFPKVWKGILLILVLLTICLGVYIVSWHKDKSNDLSIEKMTVEEVKEIPEMKFDITW